jgi:hypothetical protein
MSVDSTFIRLFNVGAFVKMRGRAMRHSLSPFIRPCCHQHAYGDCLAPHRRSPALRQIGMTNYGHRHLFETTW